MKFIDEHLCQKIKTDHFVCGDMCICERTSKGTIYILCDGIGSGIYANIAAITCAERIKELLRLGISLSSTCEMVASSMHRARKENIPFSAFSAAVILPEGQFTIYAYEAPNPLIIQNGTAKVLTPRFYTYDYEVIGEFSGSLSKGDSLLLASDGVTQSGMGFGHGFGIGSDGVADFINRNYNANEEISELPDKIVDFCVSFSKGVYCDDTTLAILTCRDANELTLLTGPPSKHSLDHEYAMALINAKGKKVVCGSTTTDIVARELGLTLTTHALDSALSVPPLYSMDGIDLSTEGAITLNQACNVLEDSVEMLDGDSPVKSLCVLLKEADVIHFHVGNAINDAHEGVFFKQVGVRVRRTTVEVIADKLRAMGKLVTKKYY